MARARSLTEFQEAFPDEAGCAAFLFERRWQGGFVCGAGRCAPRAPRPAPVDSYTGSLLRYVTAVSMRAARSRIVKRLAN
jgi:hypothetical protein